MEFSRHIRTTWRIYRKTCRTTLSARDNLYRGRLKAKRPDDDVDDGIL